MVFGQRSSRYAHNAHLATSRTLCCQSFPLLERTPHALNPPEGWSASCNNQPVGREWPYPIRGFYDPYRITRASARLGAKAKWSPAEASAMQMDLVSGGALRWKGLAALGAEKHGRGDGARRLREDLFYRLSVVILRLPPLSERPEDIPDLVKFFLQRYAAELGAENPSIQPEATAWLQTQSWPGNVRELENAVRQALLLARPFAISLEHVQQILAKSRKPAPVGSQTHAAYVADLLARVQRGEDQNAFAKMVVDLEPELYAQAIRLAQGNLARAARWLGVTRLRRRRQLRFL